MIPLIVDIGDGEALDEAIASYIKLKHNLAVGGRTAEEIKLLMGSAIPLDGDVIMDVRGRDQAIGLPRTIEIHANEVTEAMAGPLEVIIGQIHDLLRALPHERANEVVDAGIILTGHAALLRNMAELVSAGTGVPCSIGVKPPAT
jgi:rod shape-determining protein MreB